MCLKRKRHPVTLLEIMIVILLIGVIGGVLSYNLKGTLDRGKVFRTKEGEKRLAEILNLELAMGHAEVLDCVSKTTNKLIPSTEGVVLQCVQQSGFIPAADLTDFLVDGWKKPYIISIVGQDLAVTSETLKALEAPPKSG